MRIGRRGFLGLLGGLAATAVAAPSRQATTAPLYIPADRLEMGVPRRAIPTVPMSEPHLSIPEWNTLALRRAFDEASRSGGIVNVADVGMAASPYGEYPLDPLNFENVQSFGQPRILRVGRVIDRADGGVLIADWQIDSGNQPAIRIQKDRPCLIGGYTVEQLRRIEAEHGAVHRRQA